MKIGYITKYFHPIKGGAESNILNLALQAAKDGHEVHVFTSNRKGEEKLDKIEDEYKCIKIHRSKMWFDWSLYLSFYPSILLKLLKCDLDVIHASGFGFIWNDICLILKKLTSRKTKFLNTPHGPFMTLASYNIFQKILRAFYTSVQKLFLNWLYDLVIQVNTFQWRWIVRYGIKRRKIVFVPNGIGQEIIDKKISENEIEGFKKRHNLEDKFVISYLGRISEYKGIQHVIEILPQLVEIKSNITFLVMGRDEEFIHNLKAQGSRQRMSDYIKFIPNISEEEKFVGLEASRIFILPSEWEAFGIVLLEAMTRGNALVSTRTEGGNFLITEGVNGYLYEFGDTESLLKILSKLIENQGKIEQMVLENKKRVGEFSWEEIYGKYYKEVLDVRV